MTDHSEDAHASLSFDQVFVVFPGGDGLDQEQNSYFIAQINTKPDEDDIGCLPITIRVFLGAKPITLQFTKKQAMMLGNFLQLAKHVRRSR